MTEEINYRNNPLHGLGLKQLVTELVEHYGFEILYAYLNLNCFKTNPSIESSIKFLKKTEWARERIESFYLYKFKSLPKASYDQLELSPRERIIPDGQEPGEPAELSLEDAETIQENRQRKQAGRDDRRPTRESKRKPSKSPYSKHEGNSQIEQAPPSNKSDNTSTTSDSNSESVDPWAKWR